MPFIAIGLPNVRAKLIFKHESLPVKSQISVAPAQKLSPVLVLKISFLMSQSDSSEVATN